MENFEPERKSPWIPSVLNGHLGLPHLQTPTQPQQATMTCICLIEGCFLQSTDRIHMPSVPHVLI